MKNNRVPTLYEWMGGLPTLEALTAKFYERVPQDPLLCGLFAGMSPEHPKRVAQFLAEVFGGPKTYSGERGGHATMLSHHLGKTITEEQRRRWVALLLDCADELKVPDDPEFRSALVAYLEWGSRLAVINSNLDPNTPVDPSVPMPAWSWGVPGGPYMPE
ncbi:MAG TPA: group II truncated hemoglobin [Candidatus Angelobacter sp.]|nr:group II truncated hemoglobin [Candidatus Angelobacter sp.]